MPSFNAISRRYTPEIETLSRKNTNSENEVANWIIASIFIHLMLSLANSFLLKMAIAKDH